MHEINDAFVPLLKVRSIIKRFLFVKFFNTQQRACRPGGDSNEFLLKL